MFSKSVQKYKIIRKRDLKRTAKAKKKSAVFQNTTFHRVFG